MRTGIVPRAVAVILPADMSGALRSLARGTAFTAHMLLKLPECYLLPSRYST
jgi:hypothetical protein